MRYVAKPIEVEAVQWKGNNLSELYAFAGQAYFKHGQHGEDDYSLQVYDVLHNSWPYVNTNDYVVKGTKGELYLVVNKEFLRVSMRR